MINLEIDSCIIKNTNLIIFDKDGTLFELYPFWSKVALKRAEFICKYLGTSDNALMEHIVLKMGVDLKNKKMCSKGPIGINSRPYIEELIYQELEKCGYNLRKEVVTQAFKDVDAYISRRDILEDLLVPIEGLMDFLRNIRGKCKCAIFSYDLTDRLIDITQIFQIQDNFDILLGGDQLKYPKPDPWGAIHIMNELNILPENTVFFGDSALDIESGKKANCKCLIGVVSDISNIEYLQTESNITIKDFQKIKVH